LQLNEENRAKFFTPSFLENLKEKKKIYMLKRNLLEEKSKKKRNQKQKSYCQNATALSSALTCSETPASRPALRSALKKYALIHKKMLLYSFILLSPQNCT